MTLSILPTGVNANATTMINGNFNILNYKKPNIVLLSGNISTNTYSTLSTTNISSALYCTNIILQLAIETAADTENCFYKITATYDDASTSTFVSEQTVGSSGSATYAGTYVHSHTAPEGKYITNILIEGKVTTATKNMFLRSGGLQSIASNDWRIGFVSTLTYFTEE